MQWARALLFFTTLLLGSGWRHQDEGPVVKLRGLGEVEGVVEETVTKFLGVPYAEAPIGKLRWKSPVPVEPWRGVKSCKLLPKRCIEIPDAGDKPFEHASEDCLVVNIYTPTSADVDSKLPVMFWIHGGGYTGGTPNLYPGEGLVRVSGEEVVVVEVAYRLNIFGFLLSHVLLNHNEGQGGNFGLQDQRLALQWVQQHIHAFGGDPTRVMIFGQSSGGNSVLNHLVQRQSWGLYSRAVIQSGANNLIGDLDYATETYKEVLDATDCHNVDCLLQLDTEALQSAAAAVGCKRKFWPIIDGVTLLGNPADLLAEGSWNKVPVLLGSARDEYALFLKPTRVSPDLTPEELDQIGPQYPLMPKLTSGQWESLKSAYLPSSGYDLFPDDLDGNSESWWTFMRMLTDHNMGHCVHRRTAKEMAGGAGSSPPVFLYNFVIEPLAKHASDCAFIFPGKKDLTHSQKELSAKMAKYWANFAKAGDPNGRGLPEWPRYEPGTDKLLSLSEDGLSVKENFRKEACDFYDQFPYGFNFLSDADTTSLAANRSLFAGMPGALPCALLAAAMVLVGVVMGLKRVRSSATSEPSVQPFLE